MEKAAYKASLEGANEKMLDKLRTVVLDNHKNWDIEEAYEGMMLDVLSAQSSTVEDILDILQLIIDQQSGNPEFKKAFFVLKAEIGKAHQRVIQAKEQKQNHHQQHRDFGFIEDNSSYSDEG